MKSWCWERLLFLLFEDSENCLTLPMRDSTFSKFTYTFKQGELQTSAEANRMFQIRATVSRDRRNLTKSCCTFILERGELQGSKQFYLRSHSFRSQSCFVGSLKAPQILWICLYWSCLVKQDWSCKNLLSSCPSQLQRMHMKDVWMYIGRLKVLRNSTQPLWAFAICISLFNIISAVIKWSDC